MFGRFLSKTRYPLDERGLRVAEGRRTVRGRAPSEPAVDDGDFRVRDDTPVLGAYVQKFCEGSRHEHWHLDTLATVVGPGDQFVRLFHERGQELTSAKAAIDAQADENTQQTTAERLLPLTRPTYVLRLDPYTRNVALWGVRVPPSRGHHP